MTMKVHGKRERFALGFELRKDKDQSNEPALRASWSGFQIWVAGRNLTAGISSQGTYLTEVECPLLPIMEWFTGVWDPLLHEERFPWALDVPTSAAWHMASLDQISDASRDPYSLIDQRLGWWKRHGMGASLPDFRIPDLHFRRYGETIELSWDDREWRTVPGGVKVVEPPGAAYLPIQEMVATLVSFCRDVLEAMARTESAGGRAHDCLRRLHDLGSKDHRDARLRCAAGQGNMEGWAKQLRRLSGLDEMGYQDTIRVLLDAPSVPAAGYYAPLSLPVLLYRSSSPDLSETDLQLLLELSRSQEPGQSEVEKYARPALPHSSPHETTQQGNESAATFRECMGIPDDAPLTGELDLEKVVLPRLGVQLKDLHLSDSDVDGVAIGATGCRPTIAINQSGRFARSPWGRRMTIAHELCHLLHDGVPGGNVGIVSGSWAPYLAERRSNAFAATLLAPEPALAARLERRPELWTGRDLRNVMQQLGIGLTTLTRQLCNLRWISAAEREAWVEELTSRD